eukprot:GGOE01001950.1.p1 GENE.GGOE01001950.1~~GGOE01001950.1.p1  ORF type:complete len:1016 (-),score=188.51 GGOE01001950.1:180-3227(-)
METRNNVLVAGTSTAGQHQLICKLFGDKCISSGVDIAGAFHFDGLYSAEISTKYYTATIHCYVLNCGAALQLDFAKLPFHGVVLVFDIEDIASWNDVQSFVGGYEPFTNADVCVCVGHQQRANAKCQIKQEDIDNFCYDHGFEYCAVPWQGSVPHIEPHAEREGLERLREALESTMWPDYATKLVVGKAMVESGRMTTSELPPQPKQETPMNYVLMVGCSGCGKRWILHHLTGIPVAALQLATTADEWSPGTLQWLLQTASLDIPLSFSFLAPDELTAKQRNSLRRSGALLHFSALVLVHSAGDSDSFDILADFLATFPPEGPPPWGKCIRLCISNDSNEGRQSFGCGDAKVAQWCKEEGLHLLDVPYGGGQSLQGIRRSLETAAWPFSRPHKCDQPQATAAAESTSPLSNDNSQQSDNGYQSLPDHTNPTILHIPPAMWLPMFKASHPNRLAVVGHKGCGKRWLIHSLQALAAHQDDKATRQRRSTVPYGFMQEVSTLFLRTKYYTTTVDLYPVALDWLTPEESQLLGTADFLRSFHGLLLVHDPGRPDTLQALRDWLLESPATDNLEIRLCISNHVTAREEQQLPTEVRNWFAIRQFECVTVPHSPNLPSSQQAKPQSTLRNPCLTGLDRLYESCEFTKWPSVQLVPELIDTKSKPSESGTKTDTAKAPSAGALFAAMKPGFLNKSGKAAAKAKLKPKPKSKPETSASNSEVAVATAAEAEAADESQRPGATNTTPAPPCDLSSVLRDNPNRMLLVLGQEDTGVVEALLESIFPSCRQVVNWSKGALSFLHGVHVCQMTTKYYVAQLDAYWATAIDLAGGMPQSILDTFDTMVLVCDAQHLGSLEAVQGVADQLMFLGDCKLLVMLSADGDFHQVSEAHSWAVENGWELICCPSTAPDCGPGAEDGPRRIHDALASAKWHTATMVAGCPTLEESGASSLHQSGTEAVVSGLDPATTAPPEELEEEMDGFDRLVAQVMQMRLNGPSLSDEVRRERAAELCARMLRLCGEDDEGH